MKKQFLCLLLIGMMSQAALSLAGPVKPRLTNVQQGARARLLAGKSLPPSLPNRPRN